MAQRAGAAPARTRSQLQLPFAASLSKGKSTERIKQPRTWALGPYRASLWLQSICIHPLQPGAGLPQEAGGEEDEDASSPTPQSCSGAAQMQNSHCRPWDAEKLSAEIPSMLRLLPGTRTWHKEPAQITHSHNNPHTHTLSCKILIPGCSLQKGKGTSYFQSSLLQVEQECCEAGLRGSRHWLLPAKKRRNCWGEQSKHSVRMIN